MSGDTLSAADHVRGTGAILASAPCTIDREERLEAVRDPMINLFVVAVKLSTESRNCDFTAEQMKTSKEDSMEKRAITRKDHCWHLTELPMKQGTARLFALCVRLGPCTFKVLRVSTFILE